MPPVDASGSPVTLILQIAFDQLDGVAVESLLCALDPQRLLRRVRPTASEFGVHLGGGKPLGLGTAVPLLSVDQSWIAPMAARYGPATEADDWFTTPKRYADLKQRVGALPVEHLARVLDLSGLGAQEALGLSACCPVDTRRQRQLSPQLQVLSAGAWRAVHQPPLHLAHASAGQRRRSIPADSRREGQGTMTRYLSMGALSIQAWISSTPRLRLMRGASLALEHQTSSNVLGPWLDDKGFSSKVSKAAGEVAGVVVLEVANAEDVDNLWSAMVTRFDDSLPGLHWQGWSQEANTYVEAFAAAGGRVDYRSLPPLLEQGILRSCPGCRAEPSDVAGKPLSREPGEVNAKTLQDQSSHYGRACTTRIRAHEAANDRKLMQWSEPLSNIGREPKDFEDLATNGGPAEGARTIGRRDSRSHLALVLADANRFGALFEQISAAGPQLGGFRTTAVKEINEQIRESVIQAAMTIAGASRPAVRPIEIHYVGGDDVMVTVPARFAWAFTHHLVRHFGSLMHELLARVPEGSAEVSEDIKGLSLGVGLVFAHSSVPIGDARHIAETCLRQAKQVTEAKESAICYTDLTVDGPATAVASSRQRRSRRIC